MLSKVFCSGVHCKQTFLPIIYYNKSIKPKGLLALFFYFLKGISNLRPRDQHLPIVMIEDSFS